jgi:hypothetical protein
MNVVMNVDEAHEVLTLVTSQVLDNVELSEEVREAVRVWRRDRGLGSKELNEFTVKLNEALGTYIDEQTTRYLRTRGEGRVSSAERRTR